MTSTALIELLRSLDKKEFRYFHRFLKSPFFNTNPVMVQFYELLKPFSPRFDSPKLTKQNLYPHLYPDQPYRDTRMRNLISDLKLLTEEYLTQLELKEKKIERRKMLNQAYARRNLYAFFEKMTSQLLKELGELPFKDIHVYNEAMWLRHNYYFHPLTDKYHTLPFEIQRVMEDMDRSYVLGKLQFGSEIKNRERIFEKKYKLELLTESLKLADYFAAENKVFLLYKNILGLFHPKNNESAFYEAKKLLKENFEKIGKQDQMAVFFYFKNYIIRKIKSGHSIFNRDLLDLYKMGLQQGFVMDNDKISGADFTNIIHAGCLAKEFDWTEKFIDKYKMNLNEIVREDLISLGFGALYFCKKKYGESLDILGRRHFSQIPLQIQAKSLIVKIWFERFLEDDKNYEPLVPELDAFEKYISRNVNISFAKKEESKNFIAGVKKMTDLVHRKKDKKEIKETMNKYLAGKKRLISKNWFEEKINNL